MLEGQSMGQADFGATAVSLGSPLEKEQVAGTEDPTPNLKG